MAKRSRRQIKGKDHVLVVLRVHAWDVQGRPSQVEVGYDDSTFDLRDDFVSREFMTAWVLEEMTEPKATKVRH